MPAAALQDERGRGEQPVNGPPAVLTALERLRRDALPHLVRAAALIALILVRRQRLLPNKKGSADAPSRRTKAPIHMYHCLRPSVKAGAARLGCTTGAGAP